MLDLPEIKMFIESAPDGGTGYLSDSPHANAQIDLTSGGAEVVDVLGAKTVRALNGNVPFIIPTSVWKKFNTPVARFLFEGVARGSGRLVLSIYKSDHVTKLVDGPSVYIKLQDIKEMYESWTVDPAATEDSNGGPPASTARISTARGLSGFQYDDSSPEDNTYILFVHGWNMGTWTKDAFAETAYKRLWWQGYKGRFGAFQWPTTYHPDANFETVLGNWINENANLLANGVHSMQDFDSGEYTAWRTGAPLERFLKSLHSHYGDNVYVLAHSQGNVVVGEALRLAAQDGSGQIVNTYVASQAAVPVHCYDPAQATPADFFSPYSISIIGVTYPLTSLGPDTPNIYPGWLEANGAGARGVMGNR